MNLIELSATPLLGRIRLLQYLSQLSETFKAVGSRVGVGKRGETDTADLVDADGSQAGNVVNGVATNERSGPKPQRRGLLALAYRFEIDPSHQEHVDVPIFL